MSQKRLGNNASIELLALIDSLAARVLKEHGGSLDFPGGETLHSISEVSELMRGELEGTLQDDFGISETELRSAFGWDDAK